jgi:hypothetical protein
VVSSAFAPLLREALEAQLAAKMLETIRELT